MKHRVQGSADVSLIEQVNPVKDKWRIRWDVQKGDDGSATYWEEEFGHKPTEAEIKTTVVGSINDETDNSILSGFTYDGALVWLSQENQFNYKAAYDLAVQTDGKTLPVTFKFGTDDEPVYHEFDTIDELADFYTKAMQHIQDTLSAGWKRKDSFSVSDYKV